MPYIEKIPDEKLPTWLSENRLMLWTLRALRDRGGRAHLDVLHRRLGQLLRIPEKLLWLEYPPGAKQDDYVVRHRMRLGLTCLGFLGLVHSDGQGNWSLLDKGTNFLNPLNEEDVPMSGRQWSIRTGIKLTPAEKKLQAKLIEAKRADHKKRFSRRGNGGASAPPEPRPKPDNWPKKLWRSSGAPDR